jgi:tagatose 1,6-diphosphate aldolase
VKEEEMTPRLTAGKQKGLEAVSDSRGIIAAVAIDQRSALRSLFARSMGIAPESVPAEKLVQFKEAVSHILTPHASAILLDPEYGLPAARLRSKTTGLLLAYEKTGYDKKVPGRLPSLLDHWSVQRLMETGADCIKVLLYYSNYSSLEINEIKHALVERAGAECAAADMPFFLELVSYADGMEDKGIDFARVKPEAVTNGVAEFSKTKYRVDVLKVGVPVNLNYLQGSPLASDEILYTREEAKRHFRRAAECAQVPFIYLSEGVSNEAFVHALELAAEAGVKFSGVLCGRATWKDGVPVFVEKGRAALDDWLGSEGIRNVENVNQRLAAATPWFAIHGASSAHRG